MNLIFIIALIQFKQHFRIGVWYITLILHNLYNIHKYNMNFI